MNESDKEESQNASRGSNLPRVAIFSAMLMGLFLSFKFSPIGQYLGDFLEYVRSLGVWGLVLFVVVYVLATVLMIPGTILTLGAGLVFGLLKGSIVVSLGSVLGAVCAFLAARYLARGFVKKKVDEFPKFAAVDKAVEKAGFKMVLLARLSPVFPFNALNYLFGVTNVSLKDYFLASWIGMLPGTIMFVYFGTAAKSLAQLVQGKYEGGAAEKVFFGLGLLVTIAVTIYVTKVARAAMREELN